MDRFDTLPPTPFPTADRPLAGLTVLLVEDSRLASEGMRLLCARSGARLRRADTLGAAERHLRAYRPGAVIVDLHLPDGSGLDLFRSLARARPRIPAI
ncbi:MAG TPA: response regulator, partial [Rubellimicrobium sp.]|nr:response regulator [Rubellimicrobium sp.]